MNQNCRLRDSIEWRYCVVFRLTFKMLSSGEVKTLKKSYHVHHIAIFSL